MRNRQGGVSYASDFSIHCGTNVDRDDCYRRLRGTSSKQFGHKAMLQLTNMRHVMQSVRREVLRTMVPTASERPAGLQIALRVTFRWAAFGRLFLLCNHTSDVAVWHQAANPGRPLYGRFRGGSGHRTDSPFRSRLTQADLAISHSPVKFGQPRFQTDRGARGYMAA